MSRSLPADAFAAALTLPRATVRGSPARLAVVLRGVGGVVRAAAQHDQQLAAVGEHDLFAVHAHPAGVGGRGHGGGVTGLNVTVNYGARDIVSGLIRTTLRCEPGDSGAPVFTLTGDGMTALAVGVISGGSGNCTSGGTSFVQPINEILTAYGAVLT